jgi:hypothetical protein
LKEAGVQMLLLFILSTLFFIWVYFLGGAIWLYNREQLEWLWNDFFYWLPAAREPEDIKSMVLLAYVLFVLGDLLWLFFLSK